MKPIDAIRLQLKAMELVEGTELEWWEVIKVEGRKGIVELVFGSPRETYELALGIIEGKPVWEGDEYWNGDGDHCRATGITLHAKEYWDICTWLPPKPKTAMVEMLVEDIEYWVVQHKRYSAEIAGNLPKSYAACSASSRGRYDYSCWPDWAKNDTAHTTKAGKAILVYTMMENAK